MFAGLLRQKNSSRLVPEGPLGVPRPPSNRKNSSKRTGPRRKNSHQKINLLAHCRINCFPRSSHGAPRRKNSSRLVPEGPLGARRPPSDRKNSSKRAGPHRKNSRQEIDLLAHCRVNCFLRAFACLEKNCLFDSGRVRRFVDTSFFDGALFV